MIKIDKEKNLLFYKSYIPCNCVYCRNFYAQIKSVCKSLAEYFQQYNIDIQKPYELAPINFKDKTEYISCQYLVFGECSDDFQMNIGDITLRKELSHPSTDSYEKPNFVLDFAITLPNLIRK